MLLIPEVQQIRVLATAVALRCRGQIADKDYDGAVGTLKTIFAISRHMGEHPTIISGLVGVAIAQIGCNLLEELVQQPGAPNLYWALTGLPPQLVDMRKAASADRSMWSYGMFDKTRVWTADYMRAMTQQLGLAAGGPRRPIVFLHTGVAGRGQGGGGQVDAGTHHRRRVAGGRPQGPDGRRIPGRRCGQVPAPAGDPPPRAAEGSRFTATRRSNGCRSRTGRQRPGWPNWRKAPAEIEDKLARQLTFAIAKVKAAHARLEQRLALLPDGRSHSVGRGEERRQAAGDV